MCQYIIHVIIPARSGSKGIIKKNIRLFLNKPLIVWTIEQANKLSNIDRIVVTTDDVEIAEIARQSGASVPFIRPQNISDDLSTDYEFMIHYLQYLKDHNDTVPDILVHLRPTFPLRKVGMINDCINKFLEVYNSFDSLRTVIVAPKTPFKMYSMNGSQLVPLFYSINSITEPYNRCRQELPTTYLHNGCVDIVKSSTVLNLKSVSGNRIYGYVMDNSEYHDIDTLEDWNAAEDLLKSTKSQEF